MQLWAVVNRYLAVVLVSALFLFALWVYWPGQYGPPLLDDFSSLDKLSKVVEHPEYAWDLIDGDRSGPLGRPVSIASFVVEKLVFGDGVAITKRVNILLHLANSLLILWLYSRLLLTTGNNRPHLLALFAAAAWLLAPIQVSTVLYSVQRMAMLATFFMLLCIHSYLYWRGRFYTHGVFNLALAPLVIFAALGVYAKETAIVVVPVVLLLELLWFQFRGNDGEVSSSLRFFVWTMIALGCIGVVGWSFLALGSLEQQYLDRPFDLLGRVQAEVVILWDYVRQIFWPDTARLGLYHDDFFQTYSRAAVLPAALGWVCVLLVCLLLARKENLRRLSLGPLWFLAAHGPESTILPLELYFEHRNYFPAIGLFLTVAVLLNELIMRLPRSRNAVVAFCLCALIIPAVQTSTLVTVWSDRASLAIHHTNGHPGSFRANSDVAIHLASLGDYAGAREFSLRASQSGSEDRVGDSVLRDIALACVAQETIDLQGRIDRAFELSARPISSVSTLLTLVRMVQDGACSHLDVLVLVEQFERIYLSDDFASLGAAEIYSTLAVLENALERYEPAYRFTQQFLYLAPENVRGMLMQLHFVTALGLDAEKTVLIERLREKQSQGLLTSAQIENLALYAQ